MSVAFSRGALHHARAIAVNTTDIVPMGGECYLANMEIKRISALRFHRKLASDGERAWGGPGGQAALT